MVTGVGDRQYLFSAKKFTENHFLFVIILLWQKVVLYIVVYTVGEIRSVILRYVVDVALFLKDNQLQEVLKKSKKVEEPYP